MRIPVPKHLNYSLGCVAKLRSFVPHYNKMRQMDPRAYSGQRQKRNREYRSRKQED